MQPIPQSYPSKPDRPQVFKEHAADTATIIYGLFMFRAIVKFYKSFKSLADAIKNYTLNSTVMTSPS